jgi:hypothetical protein
MRPANTTRILLALCTGLFFSTGIFAGSNDLSVTLHENTLNKLLRAVGEIKGENTYEVMMVKGSYTWKLRNTAIRLIRDSALFETDVEVETGISTYRDHVRGTMSVLYDSKTNRIAVKLIDAVFALKVNVLGKDLTLKKIQLADYLSAPFSFEGPQTMTQEMEFPMPDGSKKLLQVKPDATLLKILPGKIVVDSQLKFINKDSEKK